MISPTLAILSTLLMAPDVVANPAQEDVSAVQVQFPARGRSCPHGYDFNNRDGHCYPNGTVHRRGRSRDYDSGYERRQHRGGLCPDGYDFDYSEERCFPNRVRGGRRYGY
jgi:hypothetical protein